MTTQTTGRQWLAPILAATLMVQLLLLFFSMPLSKVLSGDHSFYIDNPYHVYQLELGRGLLKQGQLLGYDPLLGAGHMGGMNDNVSARVPVLVAALLPDSVSSSVLYSLYVLACALLAPLAVAWAVHLLRWPPMHVAIASAAGLAFWWVGALHWFHTAGMASFVCACYLGLPYAAWTWKLCSAAQGRATAGLIGAGIAGGLGMWLHPLFPVVAAMMFLGLLVSDSRGVRIARLIARGMLIAAIALLVSGPWLFAMLGLRDIGSALWDGQFQRSVGPMVALKPALGLWSGGAMGSFLNPLVCLACCAGLYSMRPEQRRRVLPWLAGGVLLLAFGAFGAASAAVAQLQPNRFIAPAFLLIGLGAAYCIGEYLTWLRRSGRAAVKLAVAAAAIAAGLYTGREMVREATAGPHGHYGKAPPELSGPPPLVASLAAWISANTSADGRILFETSLARVHGGGHVAALVALKTGRELLGAGYPYSLSVVSFWDRTAFGKPIRQVTRAELSRGLALYNVGWVIAHSPELQQAMDGMDDAAQVAQFDKVRIYQINRPLSYVVSGQGRIAARGINRLQIAGAGGTELVLRYHWLPDLVASPAAAIEAAPSAPGFPPFIRVLNPPSDFTLSLCVKCRPK